MYGSAIKFLNGWKIKSDREPLIVRGARQVGKTKTWLIKESGENQFQQCHYFDFEKDKNKLIPIV